MPELTRVGVREFREELARYLHSPVPVAVTRHGQTVGYFVPAPRPDRERESRALEEAVGWVETLLTEHGVSEDEVVREFRARRGRRPRR